MRLLRTVRLFTLAAVWRALRLKSAGRALVRALGTTDENARSIAGILLVQAGRRAEPLLEEAVGRRENLPMVLGVLASLGDPATEPVMRKFVSDPDPTVADAARQALRVLEAGRARPGLAL